MDTPMNHEEAGPPQTDVPRVLKADTCPSLSQRSTLTYEIGVDDRQQLHLRIAANTGKGYYSKAWVAYSTIEPLLLEAETLSASALAGLFKGTSVNTAGFVMAVLKHLGVIHLVVEKKHAYEYSTSEHLMKEIQALIEAPLDVVQGAAGSDKAPTNGTASKHRSKKQATVQAVSTQ